MQTKFLELTHEGNTVTMTIKSSIGWTFAFEHSRNREPDAIFLYRDLRDQLWNTVEKIRRDAYEKGWSDHRSRKKKETWFSGQI